MFGNYFEDFSVGEKAVSAEYLLTEDELIAFARKWDPQSMHMDPEAAEKSQFKGLIAPGSLLVAIAIRLISQSPLANPHLIAAIGWDEVRFRRPVRPGDTLCLHIECLEARPSASKADRGVVRNQFTLVNQSGEPVLAFQDIILVTRRGAPERA